MLPAAPGLSVALSSRNCATGRGDVRAARNLISAARVAGNPHLVYISIVGVDRIPFSYYRAKLAVEKLVGNSGLPFTILRATQFHTLVTGVFEAQRLLPMLFAPSFSIQPIDVSEVSDRLVELATGDAAGRVTDIGGPQILAAKELGTAWLAARHQLAESGRCAFQGEPLPLSARGTTSPQTTR